MTENELHLIQRTDKSRGPKHCWPWIGTTNSDGYGIVNRPIYGSQIAHRITYMIHYKVRLRRKTLVLHTCDNRLCCNPNHLYVGTHQDNMNDMVKKERCDCKLSTAKVVKAKKLFRSGQLTINELSGMMGVHYSTMALALRGKTWKHTS